MSTQAIVILQGGGALGAYECGAYKVLSGCLRARRVAVSVVAGTSIGAINASFIASHYGKPDWGAGDLEQFWTEKLAGGVWGPTELVGGSLQRWRAVWESVTCGRPSLFTQAVPWWMWLWSPPPFSAFYTHFYDTEAMEQTVAEFLGPTRSYGQRKEPRLIVTAVDVAAGRPVPFDNFEGAVTAKQIVASGSLPPWFPATKIGGSEYWDGGLWSNTPLREVLAALRKVGPAGGNPSRYEVYIVDVFQEASRVPRRTLWEVFSRINEIVYADKTGYDQTVSEWVNRHVGLIETLEKHAQQLPAPVVRALKEYKDKCDYDRRVYLDIVRIPRSAAPGGEAEHISRELDFSRPRIQQLIRAGETAARESLGQ